MAAARAVFAGIGLQTASLNSLVALFYLLSGPGYAPSDLQERVDSQKNFYLQIFCAGSLSYDPARGTIFPSV